MHKKVYLARFRDNVEKIIMKKSLTELFEPTKESFGESVIGSLNLWTSRPLPILKNGIEEGKSLRSNFVSKLIKETDRNIKTKERQTKLSFCSNLRNSVEPLLSLGTRTSEVSLVLLLQK